MITVYVKCAGSNPYEYINGPVENDVERAFDRTEVIDCEAVRNVIRDIEHGEYLDNKNFKDRFGHEISLDDLSSGSKACIVLACNKGIILDTRECGRNVLDYMIHMDVDASIVVNSDRAKFSVAYGEKVNAATYDFEGNCYVAKTVGELNDMV